MEREPHDRLTDGSTFFTPLLRETQLYTFDDLANLWQVPAEIIRGHFDVGHLRGINLGLETLIWRFHADDLHRFLQRLREGSGTESAAPPTPQPRLSLPAIARLNIKSDARAGVDPRDFCFKESVAGMGGPVDADQETPLTLELYQQRATATYGGASWRPVVDLHDLPDCAVIWTRSGYGRDARFWAGLVVGPWQYRDDPQ